MTSAMQQSHRAGPADIFGGEISHDLPDLQGLKDAGPAKPSSEVSAPV